MYGKKYILHMRVYMYYPLTQQFHSYNSSKYEKYICTYTCIYIIEDIHIHTYIYTHKYGKILHTHMCRHIRYVCVCVREKETDVPLASAISLL